MRSLRIIPLIIMSILVAALFWRLETGAPPAHRSPLIGQPLPATELTALFDGASTSLPSLKGQPFLLNIFASWCLACTAEHPVLQKIAKTNEIEVVGLNWKDDSEDAKVWLKRHGNPYQTVLVDVSGEAGMEMGITGAPESFLISREGKILHHIAGPLTWEAWQQQFLPYLSDNKKNNSY